MPQQRVPRRTAEPDLDADVPVSISEYPTTNIYDEPQLDDGQIARQSKLPNDFGASGT